ncbi:hypothetical protein BD324DRAFT_612151, partial [Kockovaella imperatae]
MAEELQTAKDQLAYVNLSLDSDPTNDDLLKLKAELLELIDLTEAALGGSGGAGASGPKSGTDAGKGKGKAKDAPTNWQDLGPYKAGMDCMAKYKDGKFYPAKINAVTGSQDKPIYTITFKGYSSSTSVDLASLKPHDPSAPIPRPEKRRPDQLSEREKEKKKKKGEKWMETQQAKADDMKEKKTAWDKFGKKAQKKGIHISGLEGKSVFRTPDNPFGRVGVTGSGKGVTEYERMGKHKFDTKDD